jgi:branched-subunit amino acid transport protein
MLYPPGLHVLTALISRLSGLEPLQLFAVLAPALLLLPALACYSVARRVWGWEAGVTAALLCSLVTSGPYEHISHARYANIIAAQFLLVLALGALFRLYASGAARDGLTLAMLGSSVVFYHQVASFYEATLLALVAAILVPCVLLRDRRRGLVLLASFTALGLLAVIYAWDTYDLGRLVASLLGDSGAGRGGEAVGMALGTKEPFPPEHLLETATQPALWLGLLGALLLLVEGSGGDRPDAPADALLRSTLLFWGVLMFVGSQTALSSFPDRFERDLGVPLALLAALAFVSVLRSLAGARGPLARSLALLAALPIVVLVAYGTARNLQEADGPAARDEDRAPPPRVVAAGEWLAENNTGGRILPNPYFGPTSARGMLAMGGYSGMQAYTEKRLQKARDLPPSGAEPLWDVLWATNHPASERTRRVVRENDVRYVVLNKHFPGAGWLAYRERDELYRIVYENDAVIIFEPRYTG